MGHNYYKKPQRTTKNPNKLYENFPRLVEINMLFQHVKQFEAMDIYVHKSTGTDLNKGVLQKKKSMPLV